MAGNATNEAKKPGIFSRIGRSLLDTRGELKKVVWPTKKQVLNNTAIVIAFTLMAAVIVALFDTGLSWLIRMFFGA